MVDEIESTITFSSNSDMYVYYDSKLNINLFERQLLVFMYPCSTILFSVTLTSNCIVRCPSRTRKIRKIIAPS